MKAMPVLKIIMLLIIVFSLSNCSSGKEVQSSTSNKNVVIDGLKNDWEGKLIFDSKSKIAVGFQNDKENIFLCFTTNDRANIMKILRLGLTIWFEPKGDGKTIGIKYPLFDMDNVRDVPLRNELLDNERENPDERFKKILLSQNEISIVNEDDYPLYLIGNNDEKNIQAKIDVSGGTFIYELKVPLSTNKHAKYFIESAPNEKIKIGIVSNELKMDSQMNRPGPGMNRGDVRQPSQGQNSGRHPQGMPEGRNSGMNTEPIKLWYEVKLTN